jgi:hypothetical protein
MMCEGSTCWDIHSPFRVAYIDAWRRGAYPRNTRGEEGAVEERARFNALVAADYLGTKRRRIHPVGASA